MYSLGHPNFGLPHELTSGQESRNDGSERDVPGAGIDASHWRQGERAAARGSAAVIEGTPAPARPGRHGRRRRLPPLLIAGAVLVSVVVLLPLVFLIVQAAQVGWAQLHQLLFRAIRHAHLEHGVAGRRRDGPGAVCRHSAAWFVERTDGAGVRLLLILVVIPLGIPDFVVSFGWKAIFPSIAGFWAAVLVMTLAVYPLVFLPVAASLRGADPAQEEVARASGSAASGRSGPSRAGRPAWPSSGGAILVGLVVLAEFRRLRNPGLPDADHRDLQRVPGRLQPAGRLRPFTHFAQARPRVPTPRRGSSLSFRTRRASDRGRSATSSGSRCSTISVSSDEPRRWRLRWT